MKNSFSSKKMNFGGGSRKKMNFGQMNKNFLISIIGIAIVWLIVSYFVYKWYKKTRMVHDEEGFRPV